MVGVCDDEVTPLQIIVVDDEQLSMSNEEIVDARRTSNIVSCNYMVRVYAMICVMPTY